MNITYNVRILFSYIVFIVADLQCLCGKKEHFIKYDSTCHGLYWHEYSTDDFDFMVTSKMCKYRPNIIKENDDLITIYINSDIVQRVSLDNWRSAYEIIKQENKLLKKKILLMLLLKNEDTYLTAISRDILNIILQCVN